MQRKNITQKNKKQIGLECCNCGSKNNLEYHHIVPIALGGLDDISNICCLCNQCHHLIHHGSISNINNSNLIKQGMQNAKEKGINIGRPRTTIKDISNDLIMDIMEKINITTIAKKYNISRKTVYKYKNIIKEYYNRS